MPYAALWSGLLTAAWISRQEFLVQHEDILTIGDTWIAERISRAKTASCRPWNAKGC